jgi:hypothetical protein
MSESLSGPESIGSQTEAWLQEIGIHVLHELYWNALPSKPNWIGKLKRGLRKQGYMGQTEGHKVAPGILERSGSGRTIFDCA